MWRKILIITASVIFSLVALVGIGTREVSINWIANRFVGDNASVRIEGISGLFSEQLTVDKIVYDSPEKSFELSGLSVFWTPSAILLGDIDIDELDIASISLNMKMSSDEPTTIPKSLDSPLGLKIANANIDEFTIQKLGAGFTFERIHFSVACQDKHWQLSDVMLESPYGRIQANMTLATQSPFDITGAIRVDKAGGEHALKVDMDGSLLQLHMKGDLNGYGAVARLDGVLTPFNPFPLQAMDLDLTGLNPNVISPEWPTAMLEAHVHIKQTEGNNFQGKVSISNKLAGTWDTKRLPFYALQTDVIGDDQQVTLDNLEILLGRRSKLKGQVLLTQAETRMQMNAVGVDLHELYAPIRQTNIAGTIQYQKDENGEQIQTDLHDGHLGLLAQINKQDYRLDVEKLLLNIGKGHASLNGYVDTASDKSFDLKGDIAQLDFSALGNFPKTQINAQFDAKGSLEPKTQVQAHYDISKSFIAGKAFNGHGDIEIEDNQLSHVDVILAMGENYLKAKGALAESNANLNWDVVFKNLGVLGKQFSGSLLAKGNLSGTFEQLSGNLSVNAKQFRFLDYYIGSLTTTGRLGVSENSPLVLKIDAKQLALNQQKVDVLQVDVDGTRKNHAIAIRGKNDLFDFHLQARGGLSSDWQWQGVITKFVNQGQLAFALQSKPSLTIAKDGVALGNCEIDLPKGSISLSRFIYRDNNIETAGRAVHIPLSYLLPQHASIREKIQSSLVFGGQWDIRLGATPSGYVHFYRESGDLTILGDRSLPLGIELLDLNAKFRNQQIAIAVQGNGAKTGKFDLNAAIRMSHVGGNWQVSANSPIQLHAVGNMPSIAWVAPMTGVRDLQLGGQIDFNVSGNGTLGTPNLNGKLSADGLLVRAPTLGVDLSSGKVTVLVSGNRIQIKDGIIYGPEGNLSLSGGVSLEQGRMDSNLSFHANKLMVLSNIDRQVVLSGDGKLDLFDNKLAIVGNWKINRAKIVFSMSNDVTYSKDIVVVGREPKKTSTSMPVSLDVRVDLGDQFKLSGKGLDSRLTGSLHATSKASGVLNLTGIVNSVDGTYTALGQKLEIERGRITFNGVATNPMLDILATRKFHASDDVEMVGVSVRGSALSPNVQLVSRPTMSTTDKLSWLVLGYGGGEATETQQKAMLATAAVALLGSSHTTGLSEKLANTVGLDNIGIASSSELDDTVVSLSKRLSSRLFLTYEQGVTGVSSLIKLRYLLSKRFSIVAGTGTITAIDLLYDWRFD